MDGYIAKPEGNLDFLERVQKEGEDYGYNRFLSGIDTVIVGRKTYEWVLNQGYDYPHADKETYVITTKKKPGAGNLTFYNGSLVKLITDLKSKNGKISIVMVELN